MTKIMNFNKQELYIETPLISSQALKNKFNKTIFFKLEALQPSFSFKLRGIGRLCKKYQIEGAKAFVASSGGNAGIAVAYCGMLLNIPTTIFIPKSSNVIYVKRIKDFHAKVIVSGETVTDAQVAATKYAQEMLAAYIHPYDNPEIWAGHATIIDEIASKNIIPDAIIASVGGGGLACGLLEGMQRHNWQNIPLIAVETIGADVFAQSMIAQRPINLTQITSRATSLGATYVASKLLELATKHPIKNVVVSDEVAELGSRQFAEDQRILVELASGASLSLVYQNHTVIERYNNIVVIVCGGANIKHFKLDSSC